MDTQTWYEWATAHAEAAGFGALIATMEETAAHLQAQAQLCDQQERACDAGTLSGQIHAEAWTRTAQTLRGIVVLIRQERAKTIKDAIAAANIGTPKERTS